MQFYPNSPHAPKALELSIICKQICVGGPHYDGRKLQEARDLITKARNGYGGLSHGTCPSSLPMTKNGAPNTESSFSYQ